MHVRACCFLILLSVYCYSGLHAVENKKFELSVAAIFKNEAKYFKEWLEYHRLVGVDHFYLYNNGSTDNFRDVLSPYIKNSIVTLIDWPDGAISAAQKNKVFAWVYNTQVPAYVDSCKRSAQETTWLAMIDIDEFMVPVSTSSMTELLRKYSSRPGVMLRWHIYGTSSVRALLPRQLLVEVLHRTSLPTAPFNLAVVKSIVKPELFQSFSFPPHECVFKNGALGIKLERSEAKLNHYMNRTVDYFMAEKVAKKEHMDNRKLSQQEIETWMNMGNQMEDTERAIFKFVPELRKRMGFEVEKKK